VTQRGISSSVTFVTANADPHRINAPVDWHAIGRVPGTLVLFMGAKTFSSIISLMIEGGLSPSTPAAAVEWGTYAQQRTVVATAATLSERMNAEGIGAPVSIIIGDVVSLRDQLDWYSPDGSSVGPVSPVGSGASV
jgi:siroheme synthase